jgi:hypothetical protein
MSTLKVDTITKADGTGSLSVPAETGTVVTTASPSLGRRNLIINGAMQVAQRGTSSTGQTSGGYKTVDRFYTNIEAGTFTVTQDSDAPSGFSNSVKMDCTTAGTATGYQWNGLSYIVEAQDCQQLAYGSSDAKSLTLSFWVKSNQTGTGRIMWYQQDDSRGNGSQYTISSADTWEKKTVTITGDTTGVIDNNNGIGLIVYMPFYSGPSMQTGNNPTSWEAYSATDFNVDGTLTIGNSTSDYINITGVQLEVGSVATPFEHRSYGEELALCQRYFYQPQVSTTNIAASGSGYATGAGQSRAARFTTSLPVSMRAAGSVTVLSFSGGNTTVGGQYADIDTFTWYPLSSAAGSCYWDGGYSIDAEL